MPVLGRERGYVKMGWIFLQVDAEGKIVNQLIGPDDSKDQVTILATLKKLRSGSRSLFPMGLLESIKNGRR